MGRHNGVRNHLSFWTLLLLLFILGGRSAVQAAKGFSLSPLRGGKKKNSLILIKYSLE
jgi:hypothetical protein